MGALDAVRRDATRCDVLMGLGRTYLRLIGVEKLQILVARALEGLREHDGWTWEGRWGPKG